MILLYFQMSGRAGRRGQDLLGDVYFFDIPLPKIGKLIKSKVPELRGQFPLSISLILRLMLLATKADDLEDGKAKVLSPAWASVSPAGLAEISSAVLFFSLPHLRCSLERGGEREEQSDTLCLFP